mmetsp:Transcript_5632/g.22804  ORF Transcript_5632/g.22804 Transcript_5632/m.22804 type:complete len:210 (+) Transcript_5632:1581-2210(+)
MSYHRVALSLLEHTNASAPPGVEKKSTALVMPLSSRVTLVQTLTPVSTSSTTSSPANPPAATSESRAHVVLTWMRGKFVESAKDTPPPSPRLKPEPESRRRPSEVSSEVSFSEKKSSSSKNASPRALRAPLSRASSRVSSSRRPWFVGPPPPPPSRSSAVVARRVAAFQCTTRFSLMTYASFLEVAQTKFLSWKCTKLLRTARVLCAKR